MSSAFVNLVEHVGFTASGGTYLEHNTEQDAPESSSILALIPLISPIAYAAGLVLAHTEMVGMCSVASFVQAFNTDGGPSLLVVCKGPLSVSLVPATSGHASPLSTFETLHLRHGWRSTVPSKVSLLATFETFASSTTTHTMDAQ